MLELSTKLVLNVETIKATNLTDRFDSADLAKLGIWISDGYNRDKQSRRAWERRTEAAMDLAMQIQKEKTFPWPGCANIAFPLVTIAVLQFHSRAYPAIINGTEIAKYRVIGPDSTGAKKERADRISTHMSWQCMEEDRAWEEQHDRLLINLPCVGTAFTKSFYSPSKAHNLTELVLAKDLVLDYWAKSVETCPRKTHIVPLFRNDIHERIMRGTFRDVCEETWYKQPATPTTGVQQLNADRRQGLNRPQTDETTPFTGLEQHVELDLDQDGYAEPYIITIEESSRCVLRIVTGFDREDDIERVQSGTYKGQIIKIHSLQYFTKYSFIPSPDGGIYDTGFGILLGPLNESTNSLINQLLDGGTMSTTAGGFLGRGAKIRGGVYTFSPFGWQRVDSTGDDLRKSIFPLPVREPSAVLFQLLVLLIGYVNRVSGSTDIMVGESPGQNQPAETSRIVAEQGQKIYSAIFKRVWRSMKEEFKKLYVLNGIHLPIRSYFGESKEALREDYLANPDDIAPSADPNITSDSAAMQQMGAVAQRAASVGGYDPEEVERRLLKTLKVSGIDQIYPGLKKMPPPPNPKMAIEQIKMQGKAMQFKLEQAQFAASLMEEQRLNSAKILELQASAYKMMADVTGDEKDREINAINAMVGVMKHHNDVLVSRIGAILDMLETGDKLGDGENDDTGGEGAKQGGTGVPSLAGASGNGQDAAALAQMAGGTLQ